MGTQLDPNKVVQLSDDERENERLSLIPSDALKMIKSDNQCQRKAESRVRLFIPLVGWLSLVWGSPQCICKHLVVPAT